MMKHAQKMLALFGSTFICEQTFSVRKLNKSIYRTSVAISTWGTEPDINAVVQVPKQTRLLSQWSRKKEPTTSVIWPMSLSSKKRPLYVLNVLSLCSGFFFVVFFLKIGIFAFKCSRAEEIFNLLQELMQCNSINVVEESMMMSRSGHTPEMDMSRTPQTPNSESHNTKRAHKQKDALWD